MYQGYVVKKTCWFIIDRWRGKSTSFITFWKKMPFWRYCLCAFVTEEILKCYVTDYFKVDSKQRIIKPKKVNMLNSDILKEK